MSESHRTAAGLHPPPAQAGPFAAVQAAWRFLHNPRISLPQLAEPLICCARRAAMLGVDRWLLNVLDWSALDYAAHRRKADRVDLAHHKDGKDLGYELLTSLLLSDRGGAPLAPVCMELAAADGLHSTRSATPLPAASHLDGLAPVIAHVQKLALGRPMVHIIDREADSVGHFRQWHAQGWFFLVRADDRRVLHDGRACQLAQLPRWLRRVGRMAEAGPALFKGRVAIQWVGETEVVLHRPARQHRVGKNGKAVHHNVSGPPITLRLVVSEIRDEDGRLLARWMLLTNLPAEISAATVALWYYWRWRIESYHKLLKGAGQEVESWQQESAEALARRLTVAAMAGVVVWHLARDQGPQAQELRSILVRLSGRQMKRGSTARGFTEPALLVGLGVYVSMLTLLDHHDLSHLRELAAAAPLLGPFLSPRLDSG